MSFLGNLNWVKVFAFIATVVWAVSGQAKISENDALNKNAPEAIPGEYVVSLTPQAALTASVESLAANFNAESVEPVIEEQGIYLVKKSVAFQAEAVMSDIQASGMVEIVEPNFIYRIQGNAKSVVPNDPEFGKLWGLHNTGQADPKGQTGVAGVDVNALKAWEITKGSDEVLVAVIDTGVDYNIPDLKPNSWVNQAEKDGEAGVDDDGNGYVDDVYGYDFANNDPDPVDDHGHGSHCAGTIGAHGNDGVGVVGVAWKVKIVGVKFLTASGSGSLEGALKSIDYATKIGVDIMSNSWGGGGFSQTLEDAIKRANDKGILFVAAAGNDNRNNDSRPTYPAGYEVANVVSVAAIDNKGRRASFSNYGKKTVDIAAPGVNILSTTPGGLKSYSGTSMATPHVSGVAALLKAANPGFKTDEMKDRLLSTARPTQLMRKFVATGLVDAYAALINKPHDPLPPDPNDPANWEKRSLSVESPHPYENNTDLSWEVKVPGAKSFAIHFERFETESRWDPVTVTDANGTVVQTVSGDNTGTYTALIEGSSATLNLKSDRSVTKWGFKVDHVAIKEKVIDKITPVEP